MASSVLTDPAARLYAGALLGKSLIKNIGEVGTQTDKQKLAVRRAALEAGLASGKIKGGSLSKGDAGLVGEALHQHISSSPLDFGLNLIKNFGSDIGKFGGDLKQIPTALYTMGSAAAQDVVQAGGNPAAALGNIVSGHSQSGPLIERMGQSVAHDFSSPQQIYEHPFNPLLDVAGLFSGGTGAAIKGAGYLSRTGKLGGIGRTAAASKIIKLGETGGRAPAFASPGFTAENVDRLNEAGVFANKIPREYSPNLGMKYGVQKPLDATVSRLGKVRIPKTRETLSDFQGKYYANKEYNRFRARASASTQDVMGRAPEDKAIRKLKSPVNAYKKAAVELYKEGQGKGVYQSLASHLRLIGIKTLDMADEYANRLREGFDEDGPIYTKEELQAAKDIIERIENPQFRQLIEKPSDEMRSYEYAHTRLNVDFAHHLNVDPLTSEDSAFGRLRELTGMTTEELKAQLPDHLREYNTLAKGLQHLQEVYAGVKPDHVLGKPPDLNVMARSVPGVPSAMMRDILDRAINSLRRDVEHTESYMERVNDPNYVPGSNLFQKVAIELHRRAGLDTETAQSFARGVPLAKQGAVIPTYVPSISGEGMDYGVIGDPLKQRVGRVLGVSKFKPIHDKVEPQGTYYEYEAPFTARTASAQTLGLGPARNYLREANYESFLKGTMQINPTAMLRHAQQIYHDVVDIKLRPEVLERAAVKGEDGKALTVRGPGEMVERMGLQAKHYVFVPVDTWRNYVAVKSGLEQAMAKTLETIQGEGGEADVMAEIERLSEEHAKELVDGALENAAMGNHQGLILPKTYVENIIKHIRIGEAGRFSDLNATLVGRWKAAVLSYMPSWLIRTTIGHGIIALIDGTVNPKYWKVAHKYFENRPVNSDDLRAVSWGKKYGDEQMLSQYNPQPIPPGLHQGGMMHELQDVGQGARESKQLAVARGISKVVHESTNWQRRAIFLRGLDRSVKQRLAELQRDFEHPGGFWNAKNIDAAMDPKWLEEVLQRPDLLEHVFDQVSKVSYTFGDMAPWERKLVKQVIPFYGWYKFVTKFIWAMPVNYPGRTAAIAALGNLGAEEQSKLGEIPDYLQGAIFFNHDDMNAAKYINLYGLNPLQDPANPFGGAGPLEGLIRPSQFSPLIQAVLSGFGVNTLNMQEVGIDPFSGIEKGRYGEWIDTNTGKEVGSLAQVNAPQRMLGTFLRAFPEIRAAEQFSQKGNPVYPESIPFVDEHPIGVNPQTRRNYSPLTLAEQWFGLQPRSYDIAKHTADFNRALLETKKRNLRNQQRTAQKLAIPLEP